MQPMLYGVSPMVNTIAVIRNLKPVMSLSLEIIAIQHLRKVSLLVMVQHGVV